MAAFSLHVIISYNFRTFLVTIPWIQDQCVTLHTPTLHSPPQSFKDLWILYELRIIHQYFRWTMPVAEVFTPLWTYPYLIDVQIKSKIVFFVMNLHTKNSIMKRGGKKLILLWLEMIQFNLTQWIDSVISSDSLETKLWVELIRFTQNLIHWINLNKKSNVIVYMEKDCLYKYRYRYKNTICT